MLGILLDIVHGKFVIRELRAKEVVNSSSTIRKTYSTESPGRQEESFDVIVHL